MKKTIEEHAARFDEIAGEYDRDKSEEYRACVSLVVDHARGEVPRNERTESARGDRRESLEANGEAESEATRENARDGLTKDDTVLDLGCGTGAIGLALAADAGRVIGRDISEGMMEKAREKARERGLDNVEFGEGTFREPNVDEPVDLVVSNFAMHHLSDEEKREAIRTIADLGPRKFVLGDVMFFGEPDPEEPFYSPEVDDPATVGVLADALTDAGFSLTAVEMVHEQVGVLVAEHAG